MGTIGLDGTKIHANASRHSALSCQSASKSDPRSASKIDPPLGRARTVALAPAELVGVAQPGRARFGEVQATLVGQARFLKGRLSCRERTLRGSISAEAAGRNDCLEFSEVEVADRVQRLGGGIVL